MNNPILSTAKTRYLQARTAQWDAIADSRRNNFLNSYYHNRLRKVFSFLIPPGSRVLELGCGEGDLLAALHPSQGVGIDFSKKSLELGQKKHPQLRLI
ncbi:MAG: methyltransferase domain-containing protein, partial [Anaerolineaceae bacterium]|nr:methyltransferase domain-containing protein [Anaerolineaceae bacterium]